MGKHDGMLKRINECYGDLLASVEEIHKIEQKYSDMSTQINSLTRMKTDLDGRITAALKQIIDAKVATAKKIPEATNVLKYLQQLVKVEQGLDQLGTVEMVHRVYRSSLTVAQSRQDGWHSVMSSLTKKATEVLKQEEDKTLREGLKKIQWKKVDFKYEPPPVKK